MAFTWQADCISLLRAFINDMGDDPVYNNERLLQVLIASAHLVNMEATFSQDFIVSISARTITPDPVDIVGQTNDENFVNLICLRAACMIDTGSAILAAKNALSVKDMVFSADMRGVAEATLALLDKGWCKVYEEMLELYIYGSETACAAVMGPFRTMAFRYGRPPVNPYGSYNTRSF